ncbi:MAG TPA: 4Fe-4S binding protein [Candidatus Brocadiia bacterium]|nr:4Fe-4S binding protein [Candidatus Brocadiia bacterium]
MAKRYAVKRGCVLCLTCAHECPAMAITMTPEGAVIDPAKCVGCGRCAENCPSDAIVEVEFSEAGEPKKEMKA